MRGEREGSFRIAIPGFGKYVDHRGRFSLFISSKLVIALTLLMAIYLIGVAGFMVFTIQGAEKIDSVMRDRESGLTAQEGVESPDSVEMETQLELTYTRMRLQENTIAGHILLSSYMTSISITTIGYDDIVRADIYEFLDPEWRKGYDIWITCFVLLAYLVILYVNANFVAYMVGSNLTEMLLRRGTLRKLSHLKGHYIVCGCDRTGEVVIKELLRTEADVVAIDKGDNSPDDLKRRKKFTFFYGDPLQEKVLLQAGVKRAKGLVSVLPDAASNMYLTLTARLLNPELRIISRAVGQGSRGKLKHVGADASFSAATTAGRRMVAMLVSNRTAGFLEHMLLDDSHDCRVEQYTVNDGCRAEDRTIGELGIRSRTGVSIFCVLKKDKNRMVFNPPPSFTISSGDVLFFIANPQGKRKVARILDGKQGRGTNE